MTTFFVGLDVDRRSIAATFTDHDRLMQSLRLPYRAAQLLNYVRKHFPGQPPTGYRYKLKVGITGEN